MARRLLSIGAVLAMTLLSAFTLAALVVPGLWLGRTLVCLGVTVLVVALARSRSSSPGIPSLLGLAAGLLAALALYFPEHAVLRVLPTQDTVRAVLETVSATLAQMRSSYPPITEGDGVAFFVSIGVVVVFSLAEMLAVGAWAPAWSGLPVLGLWCVPVLLGAPVSVATLALAGAAYVIVIALQARDDARHRRRPEARAVRAGAVMVASVLVGAFVLAPTLLRVPVPVRWHPFYELVGTSTTRLDLGLGLRDDLTRSTDVDLISYTGAPPDQVGPLHAYTLTEFTGNEWLRGDAGGELTASDGQLLWPLTAEPGPTGTPLELEIAIGSLNQDRLLLPGEPRLLEITTDADYLAAADEVIVHVGGEIEYGLTVLPRILDDRLSRLRPMADAPEALLQVPETGYESDIAGLARDIVAAAGAQTPYEQVLAIQNYLRDPAEFVYSTSIDAPTTPDAVWDFLNDRHGYCVQFASAMIIMTRSLGIPARLAVGFLPGTADTDGVARVSAHDAHAWPQVLFEDVGWVRFEPTPGVQAGDPPEYAPEPVAESSSQTTSELTTAPSVATESGASSSAGGGATSTATRAEEDRSSWLIALAALVALAVLASVLAGRRARLRGPDLQGRWEHVLSHLSRIGVDVSPARTPRAVVRNASEVMDEGPLAALDALAREVETASYDRSDATRATDDQIEAWTDEVLEETRRVMHDQRRERIGV